MASALSDTHRPPAASRRAERLQVDVGSLSAGNTVTVNYTDTATSTPHTITLVRVDDPSLLPLSNDATAAIRTTRSIGIDFSGGMAAAIAQINAAIGSRRSWWPPIRPARLLRVLDDGASTATVNAVTATTTATSLTGGTAAAILHRRRRLLYRRDHGARLAERRLCRPHRRQCRARRRSLQAGALSGRHRRRRQHAAGFHLPAAHFGEPDSSRRMPASAAPTRRSPARSANYLRQVMSQQGEAASAADNLKQGQDVVLSNAAAALQRQRRRQHRPGNGQPAQSAECLCRQCARAVDGAPTCSTTLLKM